MASKLSACWQVATAEEESDDVVKFTLYVTDKSILNDYFRVRGRIMGERSPLVTLLVVNKFPRPGVEMEIETIAAKAA